MADDDLLDPSEIEALLNQTGGGAPSPPADKPAEQPPAPAPAMSAGVGSDLLDPSDIEALLNPGGSGGAAPASQSPAENLPTGGGGAEQLINEAEANLAAAIAPDFGSGSGMSQDLTGATPLSLNDLSLGANGGARAELSMLQDVELDLRIELGRAELMIEEVVALASGSVVPLDKLAGDPVDILVNGRLIARGEVLVLNDNFCVRVAEILSPQD